MVGTETIFLTPAACRQQAAGRRRWRPVLDPGTLLLPPLRAGLPLPPPPALPPPPPQPQQAQELAPAGNAAVEELVAGLTAADLADWDDWDEDSGLQGSDGQADQQQELVAVEWDAPPSPPVDSGQAKAAGAVEAGLGGCSAPAASAELADVTQDAEVAVLVQFDDCADFSAAEEEAQGQDAPAHQPPTAMQLPWLDALPEAAGGTSPAQQETPAAAGGDWPSDMGLARQGARTADSTAVDVWAELEAAPDEPSGSGAGSGQLPVGEATWDAWAQPCSLAATLDEALMAGQERREAGQPDDPWTALEAAEDMQAREHAAAAAAEAVREPAAAAGQAMSVGWPSPGTEAGCARAVSLSSSPLAISMEADDEAEDGGAFGGWGCFEDWEGDSGGALGEQATNPLQQPPQGQIDHLAVSTGCEGTAQASARGTAGSPQQPQPAPPPAFDLEWQYDDEAEENVPPQQAASACAAAGWPRPQAVARVGAGKRRHEQIGEEIIQASRLAASTASILLLVHAGAWLIPPKTALAVGLAGGAAPGTRRPPAAAAPAGAAPGGGPGRAGRGRGRQRKQPPWRRPPCAAVVAAAGLHGCWRRRGAGQHPGAAVVTCVCLPRLPELARAFAAQELCHGMTCPSTLRAAFNSKQFMRSPSLPPLAALPGGSAHRRQPAQPARTGGAGGCSRAAGSGRQRGGAAACSGAGWAAGAPDRATWRQRCDHRRSLTSRHTCAQNRTCNTRHASP